MKHNKHIHDEDYDINIKLMVPLLSILVCTICLCATTWAWYTASVSTGVNSIVAGVNATVTAKIGESDAPLNNGTYILEPNKTLSLTFEGKNAANGYYALIDITNESEASSISETLFSLFIKRVYAEESIRKAIYFSEDIQSTLTITNSNPSISKKITVRFVWADQVVNENGDISYKLNQSYSDHYPVVENNNVTINLDKLKVLVAHFYDVETQKPLPSDSQETETYNLEETKESGLVDVYEFEGTSCEVKAPEGYMIVVKNEQGEVSYVESVSFDNLLEEETTEKNVYCILKEKLNIENKETPDENADVSEEESVDIETKDSIDNQTSDTESTSNNSDTNNENTSSSDGSTESTTETEPGESNEPLVEGNNGENLAEDSSDSSTGNNEGSTATEQQTGTSDIVESLLVTDTTSGEETSNDTQSTDSSSSTDTSSETETNVSE